MAPIPGGLQGRRAGARDAHGDGLGGRGIDHRPALARRRVEPDLGGLAGQEGAAEDRLVAPADCYLDSRRHALHLDGTGIGRVAHVHLVGEQLVELARRLGQMVAARAQIALQLLASLAKHRRRQLMDGIGDDRIGDLRLHLSGHLFPFAPFEGDQEAPVGEAA